MKGDFCYQFIFSLILITFFCRQIFFVNVSFLIHRVYDLIFYSISEVTRQKFQFLGSSVLDMKRVIGKD
jgi:hypothetical protein